MCPAGLSSSPTCPCGIAFEGKTNWTPSTFSLNRPERNCTHPSTIQNSRLQTRPWPGPTRILNARRLGEIEPPMLLDENTDKIQIVFPSHAFPHWHANTEIQFHTHPSDIQSAAQSTWSTRDLSGVSRSSNELPGSAGTSRDAYAAWLRLLANRKKGRLELR